MNLWIVAVFGLPLLYAQLHQVPPGPRKASQGNQGEAKTKKSEARDNQESAGPLATAINKLTAEIAAREKEANGSPKESASSAEGWLKWSTIVSAGATFFISVLSYRQWRAMDSQRIAMETQSTYMSRALIETTKAANAARDSAVTASDTSVRQLRAYIEVRHVGCQGLNDSRTFGVKFAFVNNGQTPASEFNIQGVVDVLPYPLPADYVLLEPPPKDTQDGIIYPKQVNPMIVWVWERESQRLSVEAKIGILSKTTTKEFYAHGTAAYSDIFGITRITQFCFVLDPNSIGRDQLGNIVRDNDGNITFRWAPVANRNNIT